MIEAVRSVAGQSGFKLISEGPESKDTYGMTYQTPDGQHAAHMTFATSGLFTMLEIPRPNPGKGHFAKCVKAVEAKGGAYDPRAVCAAEGRKKYGQAELTRKAIAGKRRKKRGNPAVQSVEAFEGFHGREPDELVTVQSEIHFHKHLAGIGKLESLRVQPPGEDFAVRLTGFKGALLAMNEKRNQLFVEGGDQSIDLSRFGLANDEHEVVTLGKVLQVEYFTRKDHLGDEGGTAIYQHDFKSGKEPDLIYRVLDEQLEFSGGAYTIPDEGIDN